MLAAKDKIASVRSQRRLYGFLVVAGTLEATKQAQLASIEKKSLCRIGCFLRELR
jgi:hypothetical protein